MTTYVCNGLQHSIYSLCCKHGSRRMEGDVVYCSQNAMFVLPRKMLKILHQSEMWYILRHCMLTLSKYWEHICYIYLFTVYHCFISISKKISNARCSCIASYRLNFTTYLPVWLILTCTVHCNSSGLVLQVVFLERYALGSKLIISDFRFSFPFQFSISTVSKCPYPGQQSWPGFNAVLLH